MAQVLSFADGTVARSPTRVKRKIYGLRLSGVPCTVCICYVALSKGRQARHLRHNPRAPPRPSGPEKNFQNPLFSAGQPLHERPSRVRPQVVRRAAQRRRDVVARRCAFRRPRRLTAVARASPTSKIQCGGRPGASEGMVGKPGLRKGAGPATAIAFYHRPRRPASPKKKSAPAPDFA